MPDVNVTDDKTVETGIVPEVPTEEIPSEETPKTTDVKVEEPKLTPEQEKFEKKKLTARQRISELSHKVRSKDAVIAEKEARIKELESKVSAVPQVPNPQKFVNEDGVLNEVEYARAMSEYTEKLVESKMPKPAVSQEVDEINPVEAWEQVAGKIAEKYPDFRDAVAKEVFKPQLAQALYERALEDVDDETTVSAELSYYLGKNESEAKRLSDMPVKQMLVELGKLEEKISSLNKKTSQALEPIEPVTGDTLNIKEKPFNELSGEEVMKRFYDKELAKQKARYG